jgi:hypothetical protein
MTSRRIRLAVVGSFSGLMMFGGLGCARPVLSVEDAVVLGGQQASMVAHLEKSRGLGFRSGIERSEVRFSVNDTSVGDCDTCGHGQAETKCSLPNGNCDRFEADTTVHGKSIRAAGRVFNWDNQRTVIAVDIDETLSITDYLDLIFTAHDGGSRPIRGAVETMNALARDFNIAYVTSRPRFMLERTRQWLHETGFPDGPVIVAAGWADWRSQTQYKRKTLNNLRQQWPNLLIGIGDKQVDVDAYTDNRMLTLIVNKKNPTAFGSKANALRDWTAIGKFFADNRDLLCSPTALASRIDANGKLTAPPRDAVAERIPPRSQRPQVLNRTAAPLPTVRPRNTRS